MSEYSDIIRKTFSMGDAERDKNNVIPSDIIRFDNIRYDDKDEHWNLLDVYRPKNESGKLPVILSIHGGGWVYGDKDVYQWYCMNLAQRGFAVVNYSYRLSPEYQYPASFEDTTTVCNWIINNQDKYGFDINRIYGVGDSAGGHMLSLFAAALTNIDYKVPYKLPKDFQFKAIALNCGVYLMEKGLIGDTEKLMEDFLPNKGTDSEYKEISSIYHINKNYPPCFVMTCNDDFLKDQPSKLIPILEKNDIPFIYRRYGDKNNKLGHVFHCNIQLNDAKLCNDEECAFFKEFQ